MFLSHKTSPKSPARMRVCVSSRPVKMTNDIWEKPVIMPRENIDIILIALKS